MPATEIRQLGMVGLGRMGANIVRRLMRDGHQCVVYDRSPGPIQQLASEGATGTSSLDEFVEKLTKPRSAWVMVPAGEITANTINELAKRMEPGDIIIDGGNSYYRDDIERSKRLADDDAVAHLAPLFASLAPGVDTAPRTPGRTGEPATCEQGWLHCGTNGAGHFVKMVHNGIEYGMMAALAEGLNVLHNADIGTRKQESDAETAPLDHPEYYKYDIDTTSVSEVWRRGSVIGSWLLDLLAISLYESPDLENFSGRVSDSGEGRWTSIAAIEEGVPTPVLTNALYSRFSSRQLDLFADKALSAMRKQFGGHDEKPAQS